MMNGGWAQVGFIVSFVCCASGGSAGVSVDPDTNWATVDVAGHTFSSACSYGGLTVRGDLDIRAKVQVSDCAKDAKGAPIRVTKVSLAPQLGDVATVTIRGGGQLVNPTAGVRGLFLVGEAGGWGSFDLQQGTLAFYELRVCAGAAVPTASLADLPPVITIGRNGTSAKSGGDATVNLHYFSNFATKPIKVAFNGGKLSHSDYADGAWFYPQGGDIVVESRNGNPIHLCSGGHSLDSLGSGSGKVVLTGDGDFVWDGSSDVGNGGQLKIRPLSGCTYETSYLGNTVAMGVNTNRNGTALSAFEFSGVTNWFPIGADKGDVELRSRYAVRPTWIDLNGTSHEVNGVFGTKSGTASYAGVDWGVVSNTSATASTLTVGKSRDGQLLNVSVRGKTAQGLVVRQVGNRMTLRNADVADYRLDAGELVVSTNVTLGRLELAEGTVLTADGAVLDLSTLSVTDAGARFHAVNGGRIYRVGGDESQLLAGVRELCGGATNVWTRGMSYLEGITFCKNDATFMTCEVPTNARLAGVTVNGGTLRFGGALCTNTFWRLTAKAAKPPKSAQFPDFHVTATLGIGTIGLFDANGLNVAYTMREATGKRPDQLAAGYVMTERPYFPTGYASYTNRYGSAAGTNPLIYGASCDSITTAFDMGGGASNTYDTVDIGTWWGGVIYTNGLLSAEDPTTWERIIWRQRAGSGAACGYALAPLTNIGADFTQLTAWTLESSPDGRTWELMDERENQTDYDAEASGCGSHGIYGRYCYNHHRPYLFAALSNGLRFENMGTISVAAGAVLDLDGIPVENIAISSLAVDMVAGGGTITKFRPATQGELRLVNANRQDFVGDARQMFVDVPLIVDGGADFAHLAGWRLFVNDEPVDPACIRVSSATGRLRVFPGLAADASVTPLTDGGILVIDRTTYDGMLPLVRTSGIVTVPASGGLSFQGWEDLDDFPTEGVVLAEAGAFDLPADFTGWTFEPNDGERAFSFTVENGKLVLRVAPAYFVSQIVGPQCSFSGLGGVDILPRITYNGGSSTYVLGDGVREANGDVVFAMTGENVPTIDARLSFIQKDDETVTLRYVFTPQADVAVGSMMVLAQVPHAELSACVRDSTSVVSLPLTESESAKNKSFSSARFVDSNGVARLCFALPEKRDLVLWTSGSAKTRINFYCPTFGSQALVGGQNYTVEFDMTADRPVRTYAQGFRIAEGPLWRACDPVDWTKPGSALDFSALSPTGAGRAGRHGRVIRVGDHFEFAALPGVRQRFFGTNISAFPPTPEAADACAANFVRQGYNVMRLHMFEETLVKDTGDVAKCTLNPVELDRFDRFVAALVNHGIYLSTDIYVNRKPTWRALGYDRDGSLEMNDFKFLLYGSASALTNLMTFTRALYEHVNPYTGLKLADEPALMNLSTVNEGGLMLSPPAACELIPELEGLWTNWLAERKISEPDYYGTIPSTVPAAFDETSGGRAFAVFAAERQRLLFTRLRDFMREELGCPVLMTANLNADFRYGSFERVRGELNDFVDAHFYVDHPSYFADREYKLPNKLGSGNVNPMGTADIGAQMVVRHRHMDKPFCVTEYNYVPPSSRRGCGGLLTGAMAALQGWDGLFRYAWGSPTLSDELPSQKKLANFSLMTDPINFVSERVAATLYARGDLGELTRSYVVALDPESLDKPVEGVVRKLNDMGNRWTAWYARTGVVISNAVPAGAVSAGLWPEPIQRDKARAMADLGLSLQAGAMPPAGDGTITLGDDRFLLQTPCTLGAFLEKGSARIGPLSVDVGNMPATVWASSLDGAPIGSSRHLLVGHLTDVQNTALTYTDGTKKIMTAWGGLPHLMRVARADMALEVGKGVFRVYALNMDGSRRTLVPSMKTGNVLHFTADVAGFGEKAACLYEIERDAGSSILLR